MTDREKEARDEEERVRQEVREKGMELRCKHDQSAPN